MDLNSFFFSKTSLVNAVFILFSVFLYGTDRFSEPKLFWEFFAKSCIQSTGVQKKSKLVNKNTHVFTPLHITAFNQDFVWWIYKKMTKYSFIFHQRSKKMSWKKKQYWTFNPSRPWFMLVWKDIILCDNKAYLRNCLFRLRNSTIFLFSPVQFFINQYWDS